MRFKVRKPPGKKIREANKKIDWFFRIVQFVCGAIVGAITSMCKTEDYITIAVFAIVTGLLAVIFKDKFWKCLMPYFHGKLRR